MLSMDIFFFISCMGDVHVYSFYCRINKLTESGLIEKWTNDWIPRNNSCMTGPVTEAKTISLHDMVGPALVLALGLFGSLLCLLVEIVYVRLILRYKHSRTRLNEQI